MSDDVRQRAEQMLEANESHSFVDAGWPDVIRELLAALAQAEQEKARLGERLKMWQSWAQFVYLGGGKVVTPNDDDLRTLVCEAQDRDIRTLRKEIERLKASR
jgi:hypothetical protein